MKVLALLIGVVLLALGVAGFVPALNQDGLLFGVMPVNAVFSVLFILSGIAGIVIGTSNRRTLVPLNRAGANDMRPWM
jgi:hypothetical protein